MVILLGAVRRQNLNECPPVRELLTSPWSTPLDCAGPGACSALIMTVEHGFCNGFFFNLRPYKKIYKENKKKVISPCRAGVDFLQKVHTAERSSVGELEYR